MNNILEIRNINKKYYSKKKEVCAIDDISLDIKEGEYIAIVGPSGCGKSTLLNIIGGIDNATFGQIKIKDNKKIGYMLQSDCLFSWLNILDNCLIGLKIRGKLSERIDIRHTPELKFIFDESIKYGEKIEKIIEEINNEE